MAGPNTPTCIGHIGYVAQRLAVAQERFSFQVESLGTLTCDSRAAMVQVTLNVTASLF
jgi:hypothetical protein